MQKLLILLLGLVLILSGICVTSFPVEEKTPWENLENGQQKIQPHLLNLTNKTLLPFLNDCYSKDCCKKGNQILCPSYFEMILFLNNSKQLQKVTIDEVEKIQITKGYLEQKEDVEQFCKNFSKIIPELTLKWKLDLDIKRLIQKSSYCEYLCIEKELTANKTDIIFSLKPVCKTISFMEKFITNEKTLTTNNNVLTASKSNNETRKSNDTISNQVKLIPTEPQEMQLIKQQVEEENKQIATSTQLTEEQKHFDDTINDADKMLVNTSNSDKTKDNLEQAKKAQQDFLIPNIAGIEYHNKQEIINSDPLNEQKENALVTTNEGSKSTQSDRNQENINSEAEIKDINNENIAGKIPAEQQLNEGIIDINPEDPDEGLNGYDDDTDPSDIKPPQANIKQLLKQPKEPTTAQVMEKVSNDIQKTGTNYIPVSDPFFEEAGSNFFTYLLAGMFICILLYVLYHNKTKVLALILEGRRSQKGRSGRKKHTAQYRKLDTNLEEAITSSTSGKSTQIIY